MLKSARVCVTILRSDLLLQASFDAAMAQKQALEDDATATQRKMDSANALLSALAGEEGRWTQQSKEFDDTIQKLTGKHIMPRLLSISV